MLNKKIVFIFLAAVLIILSGVFLTNFYLKPKVKPPTAVAPILIRETEVDTLSFYSWLVSPGEKAAINALINLFSEKYPETMIMPVAIGGGAGYAMTSIVKPLVVAGQAPDTFQMHAGYEGLPYYRAGFLESMDDIWESEKLAAVIPSVVQNMNKFEGHYYSVPTGIHRVNLIWYNKDLLFKNGLDASEITSWEEFFKACDKLKAAGIKYPIQIGEPWTVAHVFEQMAAGEGIEFYQDWINGKITSANDARLLRALKNLKEYLNYVNPNYENLTWDAAVSRLISQESVFNVMGDWADKEFELFGKKYGTNYGAFPVPGTKDIYGICVDTFQRPKNILHPTSANRWLKLVASQEGQDVFNSLKGSISARTDADISQYDDYQRSAISDFWKARYIFPSVVHGSGAPQSFKFKLNDIIANFMIDRNIAKAAATMASYTAVISDEYVINWSLK